MGTLGGSVVRAVVKSVSVLLILSLEVGFPVNDFSCTVDFCLPHIVVKAVDICHR